MKRILIAMCVGIMLLSFAGCTKKIELKEVEYYSSEYEEETMIVVENDSLELHFDASTTHFYVVDKKTNETWYSTPTQLDADTTADSQSIQRIKAAFTMQYADKSGTLTELNTFKHSVEKGLYEVEEIENGVRVKFTIGEIERVYLIPVMITESRLRPLLDQMEKNGQNKLLNNVFKRYDISKMKEKDIAAIIEKYPEAEHEIIYELRGNIAPYLKAEAEMLLEKAGYTKEDYDKDMENFETEEESKDAVFNIVANIFLDEDELVIDVPLEEVRYTEAFPMATVQVYPYFGAGYVEDEGFLFVPDGNGALINFNNGKTAQDSYYANVYGYDYGLLRSVVISDNTAQFPIYGISKNENSFITVIEEGSSLASIIADISGKKNGFNYVAAKYQLIHSEALDISSKSAAIMAMHEKQLPEISLKQRYIFCEESGYVAMAKSYREYFMEQYPNLTQLDQTYLATAVDIIGGIDVTEQRFGMPKTVVRPLTTYDEAKDMIATLSDKGWDNILYKYRGWFNDGIQNDPVANNVKLIKKLGNKKDFKELVSAVNNTNSTLYLEAELQRVYNDTTFNSFVKNRDASRLITREIIEHYHYSNVYFGEDDSLGLAYLARPAVSKNMVNTYANKISDLNVKNIGFASHGSLLYADYNDKKFVSREDSMNMQEEMFKQLKEDGYGLNGYVGNAYAIPYMDMVNDMPLNSKGFLIFDEDVPFFSIALHGLVNYTGEAINISDNYQENLLATAETGAGLYFIFMNASTKEIQETNYTQFFGADFEKWSTLADEVYKQYSNDFAPLASQLIDDHKILENGLRITTYEDGTEVLINYSKSDITYEDITVLAGNYAVKAKGGQ